MSESYSVVGIIIKFSLLLTPFFALSMFVTLCGPLDKVERKKMAFKSTLAIWIICVIVYFLGDQIFSYLGITLDAFRIGAGLLLLLSGVDLVRGKSSEGLKGTDPSGDITVVPMAIPYTVGPGTVGALVVMGATQKTISEYIAELIGITTAVMLIGALLIFSDRIVTLLGKKGLDIAMKVTGIFLCALASQLMFEGIVNFFVTGLKLGS